MYNQNRNTRFYCTFRLIFVFCPQFIQFITGCQITRKVDLVLNKTIFWLNQQLRTYFNTVSNTFLCCCNNIIPKHGLQLADSGRWHLTSHITNTASENTKDFITSPSYSDSGYSHAASEKTVHWPAYTRPQQRDTAALSEENDTHTQTV